MGWGGEGLLQQAGIREAKPEQDEGDAMVKAIYIMYKLWLISPLGWQRPRWAQAPWPRGGGTRREGQAVQHLLGTRGGGEEVPMAPPDTKTWREFFK